MATNSNYTTAKPTKKMYISIALFVMVLVLTIWLFIYNSKKEAQINALKQDLSNINLEINNIKKEDRVVLYTLIDKNRDTLDRYKNLSQIPKFISNIKGLSRDFSIWFDWFRYSNWDITTTALVQASNSILASSKVNTFFEKFREEDDLEFSLDFVNNFVWQESITFNTVFSLK